MSNLENTSSFDTKGIIYSSGHVHIPCSINAIIVTKHHEHLSQLQDEYLTQANKLNFVNEGYCCIENCVDLYLIHACKTYIDDKWSEWINKSKRTDDWRCHYEQDFSLNLSEYVSTPHEHSPLLDLLVFSNRIRGGLRSLMGEVSGIFYTQIAIRTPVMYNSNGKPTLKIKMGTDYHIDCQINNKGCRFPDHWTVMVGVALSDISFENTGNFTVFPRTHLMDWRRYPDMKMEGTLPDLGEGVQIRMKAGDAIFVHVLLAHKGGCNLTGGFERPTSGYCKPEDYNRPTPWGSREMVFFRLKANDVDYRDPQRGISVLTNPWVEHDILMRDIFIKNECEAILELS